MEPVVWTEALSVGVRLFDRQHKTLIGILNRMIENPAVDTRSETVSEVLTELTRYALEHFKSEEDLMAAHGYPDLELHERQHQRFWEKLTVLCKDTAEGSDTVPSELLDFLQQWLTRHILEEDMAYKSFFEALGEK